MFLKKVARVCVLCRGGEYNEGSYSSENSWEKLVGLMHAKATFNVEKKNFSWHMSFTL